MRKDELTLLVLSVLNEHLNLVTYCKVLVVTELRSHDDALALVTDVDDDLSLADRCNDALYDLALYDL